MASNTAIFDMKALGLETLQRGFRNLPKKFQRKVLASAIREGGKIALAASKEAVPTKSQKLKRGLKLRAAPRRGGTIGVLIKTPERDKLDIPPSAKGYYPAAIEYGFRHVKSGKNVPSMSYLRDPLEKNSARIIIKMKSEIAPGIKREAKKAFKL